jgi:Protein of unknown function (DUF4238)
VPRHHLVPQFLLRNFANQRDQLRAVTRDDLKARSSRIGCILTCGPAAGSWVKSAWPRLRPNAHDWSRSARYAYVYCLPMRTTSRAS